jgi:type III secretory pathway component EscV
MRKRTQTAPCDSLLSLFSKSERSIYYRILLSAYPVIISVTMITKLRLSSSGMLHSVVVLITNDSKEIIASFGC